MAFRRKFRKRARTVWLPNESGDTDHNYRDFSLDVPLLPSATSTVIAALTVDYPPEAVQNAGPQPPTVADYVLNGYRLERFVGKVFLGMAQLIGADQPAQNYYPTSALVGAGLIVLRVDEGTGSPLRVATPNEYSPLVDDNERDPWIWRRTWVLANDLGQPNAPAADALAQAPRSNMDYGSVMDGPHIDTSSKRFIGPEERLFFVASATNIGNAADSIGAIRGILDYRILVVPHRASNRGNASR